MAHDVMKVLIPWISTGIAICASVAVACIGVGLYAMQKNHKRVQDFTCLLFVASVGGMLLGSLALLCWG